MSRKGGLRWPNVCRSQAHDLHHLFAFYTNHGCKYFVTNVLCNKLAFASHHHTYFLHSTFISWFLRWKTKEYKVYDSELPVYLEFLSGLFRDKPWAIIVHEVSVCKHWKKMQDNAPKKVILKTRHSILVLSQPLVRSTSSPPHIQVHLQRIKATLKNAREGLLELLALLLGSLPKSWKFHCSIAFAAQDLCVNSQVRYCKPSTSTTKEKLPPKNNLCFRYTLPPWLAKWLVTKTIFECS